MQLVDFTQPYLQSSLKMVTTYGYEGSGQLWNFLEPFHPMLWGGIGAIFILTGVVIFIIEYDNKLFHGKDLDWRTRMANIFWYTSMTLFFCQRTDHEISTRLGRVLTVFWLMVVLIFTSSYTASLTSILSTQRKSETIESFEELWRSNLQVGYQAGSFMEGYMEDSLKFRRSRLVELVTREDYVNALELGSKNGGVAAILDESPYLETFINSECAYTTSGPDIAYFGGLGFAFQKNSNLTDAISLAIVSLSRNRELQTVKESWLGSRQCTPIRAGTYIPVENFGGLFIVIAGVYGICVILRILGWILHAYRRKKHTSRSLRQVNHDDVQEDQNQQEDKEPINVREQMV